MVSCVQWLVALGMVFAVAAPTLAAGEAATAAVAKDTLVVDRESREIRFTATVTRDDSAAAVHDWGTRGQAWIGTRGGKAEKFFIFTTDVDRAAIDQAVRDLGVKSLRQIPKEGWEKHQGLKTTTTREDYLDGDPMIASIHFEKDGRQTVLALEELIEEKVAVGDTGVVKPYTPHWVYHGTGEAIRYPSGCILCPSDCFGGIITDNSLPLLTMNQYKVDWSKMPPVGAKVEIVLKSIH